MADVKKTLIEAVKKTAETQALKPEAVKKMEQLSEAMKKAATTLPGKKG